MRLGLYIAILILGILPFSAFSQNGEIQIYSGEKKSFTLFVDGLKENEAPKWKVKVKNLPPGPHHLRVLFENGQTSTIQKKINLAPSSMLTYEILLYENTGRSWYELTQVDSVLKEEIEIIVVQDISEIKELEKADEKADSLLEVNIPDPKITAPNGVDSLSMQIDTAVTVVKDSLFQCSNPLLPLGFDLVIKQLESEDYEDLLLDKAKKLADINCFSSIQIMEVMQLMQFEVTRLEFAIYCYKICFDPVNYKFVEDAFEYQSSIDKLHDALYAKPGKKSAIK
jgi:hypothetical protein